MTARYDIKFRNEAVKLALMKGQSITQTAVSVALFTRLPIYFKSTCNVALQCCGNNN